MADKQEPGGVAELEKLAAGLDGTTYAVTLVIAEGRRPCLSVTNRHAAVLTELIYAAPDGTGEWFFWWGWADRIAQVEDLAAATAVVDRVLRTLGGRARG